MNGEILACQIVNGQPAVARFSCEELCEGQGIGGDERAPSRWMRSSEVGVQRSGNDARACEERA